MPPKEKMPKKTDLFLNLDQVLRGYFSSTVTRYHNEKIDTKWRQIENLVFSKLIPLIICNRIFFSAARYHNEKNDTKWRQIKKVAFYKWIWLHKTGYFSALLDSTMRKWHKVTTNRNSSYEFNALETNHDIQ